VLKSSSMKEGVSPLWQAAMGTLFTWALTAAGSALVFVFRGGQVLYRSLFLLVVYLTLLLGTPLSHPESLVVQHQRILFLEGPCTGYLAFSLPGLIHSHSASRPIVPNSTLALSLPDLFAPWLIRSLELSLPGPFAHGQFVS